MFLKTDDHFFLARRWIVFGTISSIYFFVYFHRVSSSVIAPSLLATFQTNATALGFMSSMYFYLYAVEQPLIGYLSDRFGPRRVVALWTLVAALGSFVFALAPTIMWAAVGRAIIGLGVGGVFVPGMKAFSQWFKEKDFATLTGLLLASGNMGAVFAATPLAWMADTWGWRSSFMGIGGVTFMLAIAAFLLIGDPDNGVVGPGSKEGTCSGDEQTIGLLGSILDIMTSLRFWILGMIFSGAFGAYLTFQGLWATTYFMSLLELDLLHASNLTMVMPIGFILGAPFAGWLSNRFSLDKVHMIISFLGIKTGLWVGLVFGNHLLETDGVIPFLILLGMASGGLGSILWAFVRETTPSPVLGLTTGLLNPFPMVGVAIMQVWTGAIMDSAGRVGEVYTPEAYREAFFVCLLLVAGCLGLSLFLKKYMSWAKGRSACIPSNG